MSLTDLLTETEVALYSQRADGTLVEIRALGYARMPYAEYVTFEASEDWPPITHVATIVRGEILLRPTTDHVRLVAGRTVTIGFGDKPLFLENTQRAQHSYVVGQWMT